MKAEILGYTINDELPIEIGESKMIINTINPHSYCVAKKDVLFKEALQKSDTLIPDGIGIVWAVRFLNKLKIKKIAGADLHTHMLEILNKSDGRCFYLGSTQSTLDKIKERLQKEQANVQAGFFSPPYRQEFSEEENYKMIACVNDFAPDVLFVGMTAPKQEKWVYEHRDQLNAKIICSIGAVFDFYAGTVKRPGLFWQKIGLEWLPRLVREPRRLWRRNFISTPCFIIEVFIKKINKNLSN